MYFSLYFVVVHLILSVSIDQVLITVKNILQLNLQTALLDLKDDTGSAKNIRETNTQGILS